MPTFLKSENEDLLGEYMDIKEVAQTLADVAGAHFVLKKFVEEDRANILSGITLGALGYGLGPNINDYLKRTDKKIDMDMTKNDLLTIAAGAAVGGIGGYVAADDIYRGGQKLEQILPEMDSDKKHEGLLAVLGGGWLGYSLLVSEKDETFEQRQRWGLTAGALGYVAGPPLLRKLQHMTVGDEEAEDGIQVYKKGFAALGTIGGAGEGLYIAKK